MYFLNRPFPSAPQILLPETLRTLEELFGVVITLHDCFGQLYDASGEHFLELHMRHRHPFCRFLRKEQPSCNAECVKNCLFHAESYARKQDSPFLHHCWKGAWELVVPIRRNGILQFLFYAGVFRQAGEAPPSALPEAGHGLYRALPAADWKKLEGLEYLLKGFGSSLLQYIGEKRPETEYDRHSMLRHKIRSYLSNHIHQPIRLRNLADVLHLSETRTGHLVKRLFSVPFQTLVEDERINRALNLLRDTELPLKNIAEKTGFRNEYYFSRVFRRRCGTPPGKYRKQCCGTPSDNGFLRT